MKSSVETIASNRIKQINKRLNEISIELKASQPKAPGAITIHHYNCGKSCSGCPHSRWKQWFANPRNETRLFLSKTIKNPLKRIKTSGEFAENASLTRSLIKEAEVIIKEKTAIIKSTKDFEKIVTGAIESSANSLDVEVQT